MKTKFFSVLLLICVLFAGCKNDYVIGQDDIDDIENPDVEVFNQKQEIGYNSALLSCQLKSNVTIKKVDLVYYLADNEEDKLIESMVLSDSINDEYSVTLKELKEDTEYIIKYRITYGKSGVMQLDGKSFRTSRHPSTNITYQTGAIKGAFAVSDKKYVAFSKGNLRYNAATNIWSFAANQYDVVGEANKNVSATYNGDIDLFMYGTSGYDSYYAPYYSFMYHNGGDITNTEYDWGVFNKINNGGNQVGLWRTLSREEWEYLISHNIVAKAQIGSTKGMIILPDHFEYPDGIGTIVTDATYSKNYFNESDWVRMEDNGAVFLPVAGNRQENGRGVIYWSNNGGHYWSTTGTSSLNWALGITDKGIFVSAYFNNEYHGYTSDDNAYYAYSVRLVCDLN